MALKTPQPAIAIYALDLPLLTYLSITKAFRESYKPYLLSVPFL